MLAWELALQCGTVSKLAGIAFVLLCSAALIAQTSEPVDSSTTPSKSTGAPDGTSPQRVQVEAGQLIHRVAPIYPKAAKKHKISGTVLLHAVITKEGAVRDLAVISGPPELQQAAIDAVSQWTYKPYVLKGQAVEVETTIQVNFTLAH